MTGLFVGYANDIYFSRVNADPEQAQRASVKLALVSLHQDEITKSRILWERIMRWVYHIEMGSQPEGKRFTTKFFNFCKDTPRWRWLAAYEPVVKAYDDRFRKSEVHKRSTLRGSLMRGEDPAVLIRDLKELETLAMNQVWDNVQSIVGGGGVVSLGRVHGDPADGDICEEWGWQPDTA